MRDNDELFTIEIKINLNIPEKKKEAPAKQETTLREDGRGQFVLFAEAERKRQEEKRKEYLRLREAIFNRNRGPVNCTFLQQAAAYANEEGEPAEFVPFSCYWPTYDVMTDSQLKYYFYWRGQVRNGIYPQTSLSYIFIYIYELINKVGIQDKADGLLKLCAVWGEYRTHYPNLDRYLKAWVADYIAIHFPDGLPEGLLAKIPYPDVIARLPDHIVSDLFLNAEEPDTYRENILDFLLKYSNYKLKAGGFYQNYAAMVDSYLPDAFRYLNKYLRKKTGKGIFDAFKSEITQKKMPYQNAVYQGNVKWIETRADDYVRNKPLQGFITAVMKETENCLRGIVGYKGKLKSGLDDEYARVLRKFILEKYKNKKLEEKANFRIDHSKVQKLIENAEIIRDKLLADIPEAEFEETAAETEEAESAAETSAVTETDSAEQVFTQTDDPYGELTAHVSDLQRKILGFIMERGGTVTVSELSDVFSGVFLDMEIDSINEAAIDCIGDILLLTEGDNIILQE